VVRVAGLPFDVGSPIRRGLDHLYLAASLFAGALAAGKPDVVYFYSPPLTLGLTAWTLGTLWRVPCVAGIQDLFPKYAVDIGLMTKKPVIRAFEALERFVYRTADAVTVNSPGSAEHVVARGGRRDRVHVISNWVDVDELRPATAVDTAPETGSRQPFLVQYAGTMGYQQDLDTVIRAASLLAHEPDVRFQLIGDGVERERLEALARDVGAANVEFVPTQPRERFAALLRAAGVCLVPLRSEVKTPAIPSKLLTIMAAGRPVIVSADPSGDAARTVREVGCGLCVDPGRPDELAEAVCAIKSDPGAAAQMGQRGRRHAEAAFSRQAAARRIEAVFADALRLRERRPDQPGR
jgi:glycosyltransferase involved in cell wall biosynthesis